jgi:hypothetical protein
LIITRTTSMAGPGSDCATLEPAVALDHHAVAGIIMPIAIIGAGIRAGRGRVM